MWICKRCDWKIESGPEGDWDTCPNCNAHAWMREGERNDIRFVTDPPTEPGLYFVVVAGVVQNPVQWELKNWKDEPWIDWRVSGSEWDAPFEASEVTHWLGPLPIPDAPQ